MGIKNGLQISQPRLVARLDHRPTVLFSVEPPTFPQKSYKPQI